MIVAYVVIESLAQGKVDFINVIPTIITAFATLFAIPGAILGVTAWGRNKLKQDQVSLLEATASSVGMDEKPPM